MNNLKQPITINQTIINNRLVLPPMATEKSTSGGVTPQLLSYYDEKSKGGYIGLIITEHSYVSEKGIASKGQVSISKDEDIEGFKAIADIVHANGSKIIAQINHAGSAADVKTMGIQAMSASAVVHPGPVSKTKEVPKEMTTQDINEVIEDFVNAAKRVEAAGFDGVEIHAAHGYLLSQFYSPITNKRTDEYRGSTLEGRIRLHVEIVKAVREAVAKDFIVAIRLGSADYMEGGATIEDSVIAVKLLEEAGADLLDISGGLIAAMLPGNKEQGYFAPLSEAIKEVASVPVILTGGVVDGNAAEQLLVEEKADMIGVGRAILKDSNWAKETMEY